MRITIMVHEGIAPSVFDNARSDWLAGFPERDFCDESNVLKLGPVDTESEYNETQECSRIDTDRIGVAIGLALLGGDGPGECAARVINETGDANDADVILQYAVFGRLVYG